MLGVGHAETPELFQFSVAPSGSRNCRGSGRRPYNPPSQPPDPRIRDRGSWRDEGAAWRKNHPLNPINVDTAREIAP